MGREARKNPSYLTLYLTDDEWEELEKRANKAKLSITEWARLLLLAAGGNVSLIKDLINSHRLVLTTIDEFGQLKEIGENWRNRYNEAQVVIESKDKEIKELKRTTKGGSRKTKGGKKSPAKKIKKLFPKKKATKSRSAKRKKRS